MSVASPDILQATVEVAVELGKFYNVDLFQRGFYQIRCSLKSSPKVACKIEVRNWAKKEKKPQQRKAAPVSSTAASPAPSSSSPTSSTTSPSGGETVTVSSRAFQILYRNEVVKLSDVTVFRLHAIVDANKVEESLSQSCELQLLVELWYSETGFSSASAASIECVSSRLLTLNVSASRGLHTHLPILFDYFHLSAVSLTVHAALVALHQAHSEQNGASKGSAQSSKTKRENRKSKVIATELKLRSSVPDVANLRLTAARRVHHDVCSVLLKSYESLQASLAELTSLLAEADRTRSALVNMRDCAKKLQQILDAAQPVECEEEFLSLSVSDVTQLCGETVLLWNAFLEAVTCKATVARHLATLYHTQRVKRFSEGFYMVEKERTSALECMETDHYALYAAAAEAVRASKYLSLLPSLPVACLEVDGDSSTLPVIFEDVYGGAGGLHGDLPRRHSLSELNEAVGPAEERHYVDGGQHLHVATKGVQRPASMPQVQGMEEELACSTSMKDLSQKNGEGPSSLTGRCSSSSNIAPSSMAATATTMTVATSMTASSSSSSVSRSVRDSCGFSHLEWSSSVPYNLSEEPDEVSGMTHSHSCDAFQAIQMIESGKQKPPNAHDDQDQQMKQQRSPEQQRDKNEASPAVVLPKEDTLEQRPAAPSDLSSPRSVIEAIRRKSEGPPFEAERRPWSVAQPSQDELARRLEAARVQSRSTVVTALASASASGLRARARSTPGEGDLGQAREHRPRLKSDGQKPSFEEKDSSSEAATPLTAPNLVRDLLHMSKERAEAVLPPPPAQFRDPAEVRVENGKSAQGEEVHVHAAVGVGAQADTSPEADKGQSQEKEVCAITPVPAKRLSRNGKKDAPQTPLQKNNDVTDGTSSKVEKAHEAAAPTSNCYYLLIEATGDCLETKPLPAPRKNKQQKPKEDQNGVTPHRKLVSAVDEEKIAFAVAKEEFKKAVQCPGVVYSDLSRFPSSDPYFHVPESNELQRLLASSLVSRSLSPGGRLLRSIGTHLVVCVHGLDGNAADLRLIRTYLEMALPANNMDFLMSENNQGDTFVSFEAMTERLVDEILSHVRQFSSPPSRISFVGHSLGCILVRSAITRPRIAFLTPRFHTFLALSGPHLGTLYNNSGLVNMGMWFMQRWKKSGSLHELALKDATDIRSTFLYRLSQRSNLHLFNNVLLAASTADRYVPWHSARIEMCKSAAKDNSITGAAYREMVSSILRPIVDRPGVNLVRYDIHHALPSNTNAFIGRAAHIAVLDSELFIEKFLVVSALKYFK